MVNLLKHNQEAYEKVKSEITNGKKKLAVSHATGTGKSYLIAKLFEDYSNDKKLVLVPSTYIHDQIMKLFEKYSIQNADVILYQKLIRMPDEDIATMDYDVIALDEYHHDTSKVWGNKVKKLIDTHLETIIFGTSATPVRSDGVNTIDELFEGNCASDLPLSESIAKKIVPLPKYVGALYKLDDELDRLRKKVEQATNTKEEKFDFYKKIDLMRSQIEKSYGMPIILNKHIKDKEGKYLVFCKKKRHLREIKETVIGWFRTAGCKDINAYEVYSNYENKDAEYKAFCDDTSHNLKLLFCVDMLNEGLHLENISGVLLLRPTRSSIVWHQQIGRAIEANNTNTPVIIDAVNNFSAVGQGMELMREIKEDVTKEKESDPNYDDSGFDDIDTFFVVEQVIEIKEMFAEIEGRLEGSWELYIKALKQYKEREGDCLVPQKHVEFLNDNIELKLGYWVADMRQALKGKQRYILTQERINQLNDLGFVWEKDNSYTKFYRYALLYKERYGHVNIKYRDQIDGYKIGNVRDRLYKDYKKGKLTEEQANKLKDIGIDITLNNFEKQFKLKVNLARQALEEGVIITQKNNKYKGVDLYNWYLKNKSKFSKEEIEVLQRLIKNMYKPVLIVDIKNCKTFRYSSMADAGRALCNDFHIVNTERCGITTIFNNLKVQSGNHIYKDRFRFEYAD